MRHRCLNLVSRLHRGVHYEASIVCTLAPRKLTILFRVLLIPAPQRAAAQTRPRPTTRDSDSRTACDMAVVDRPHSLLEQRGSRRSALQARLSWGGRALPRRRGAHQRAPRRRWRRRRAVRPAHPSTLVLGGARDGSARCCERRAAILTTPRRYTKRYSHNAMSAQYTVRESRQRTPVSPKATPSARTAHVHALRVGGGQHPRRVARSQRSALNHRTRSMLTNARRSPERWALSGIVYIIQRYIVNDLSG